MTSENKLIEVKGWGGINSVFVRIFKPKNLQELKNKIKNSKSRSLITRGLGRSYGDAAQLNGKEVIVLSNFCKIELDIEEQTLKAGGGASFDEILKYIVPKGFFLPVSPGTKYVTVGGAIAADVHGKNHHKDGSFGNHLLEIRVIDGNGNENILTPNNESQIIKKQFFATVGGMGLTGTIFEAKFKLIKIETSFISVNTSRFEDLKSLMKAMLIADKEFHYSVAWVDSLHKKNRGVLTCGDHATKDQLQNNGNNLYYDPKSISSAPSFLPNGLLNNLTVKLFNEAWYRKSPKSKEKELQTISQFFHPLDGIKNWNNIYGKNGFIQYQFVVPDSASYLISKTLEVLKDANAPSFLTVLKRFGKNNNSYLSFPFNGWTLAVDVPANISNLKSQLDFLDGIIAKEGGRIYLAKDSRQTSEMFLKTYENLNEWLEIKKHMDPENKFMSDLAERIRLY